ncbi:hypothetical protein IG193_00990 [Infirmifilum lucidum]|uniref:Uncharacterized protein n=1 Tax=Infirmifilum lucidum TaxID=2776706 RepID=A0A7L9FJH0_9CREN|nr:hypothetical protein [Infirmifilum lucidum]QOJ79074.1 hypothetical protein IG193_00990 [Infirmifilum lucidum]
MPIALLAPRLRLARVKLASTISREFASGEVVIALPYPPELEKQLNLYSKGLINWTRLKLSLRNLYGDFYRSWLWVEEPLLRAMPVIGAKVKCYGSRASEYTKRGGDLAVLAFKARARGEINLEEWRKVVEGRPLLEPGPYDVVVSSAPMEGFENRDLWGLPYPPSEALGSSPLTREAVLEYVDYVFNYIVKSRNLDEAYLRWLEERKGVRAPELWRLLELVSR